MAQTSLEFDIVLPRLVIHIAMACHILIDLRVSLGICVLSTLYVVLG